MHGGAGESVDFELPSGNRDASTRPVFRKRKIGLAQHDKGKGRFNAGLEALLHPKSLPDSPGGPMQPFFVAE